MHGRLIRYDDAAVCARRRLAVVVGNRRGVCEGQQGCQCGAPDMSGNHAAKLDRWERGQDPLRLFSGDHSWLSRAAHLIINLFLDIALKQSLELSGRDVHCAVSCR